MEAQNDKSPAEAPPAAANERYILRYLNARVTLHYTYGGGFTDTGRITFIDNHWVELVKDNTERLLAPVVAIRLIKLHEPAAQANYDAQTLLRAANERKQISDE